MCCYPPIHTKIIPNPLKKLVLSQEEDFNRQCRLGRVNEFGGEVGVVYVPYVMPLKLNRCRML